ncbi:MAG: glutamate 5-kinase [Clostridia bacterium]|nr:glutamate 5-kinase [Clostridia bacterium]
MKTAANAKRIVFKVGTSTLTHPNGKPDFRKFEMIAQTLSDMQNSGLEVVLVSSGAISAGCAKLGIAERPSTTAGKQAVSAVGQSELMRVYDHYFAEFGHKVAQILLTRDELDRETVRENAASTFDTLIGMGVIPIVNENDSLSYYEIEFGDNDTLSAHVALLCRADALILLSDIDGFCNADPRSDPNARLIERVDEITDEIRAYAGGAGTRRGTGGLVTKLNAAEIVTAAGIPMYIINGSKPELIYDLREGRSAGTFFAAKEE